jgi:hypothetical protein
MIKKGETTEAKVRRCIRHLQVAFWHGVRLLRGVLRGSVSSGMQNGSTDSILSQCAIVLYKGDIGSTFSYYDPTNTTSGDLITSLKVQDNLYRSADLIPMETHTSGREKL